MPRAGPVARPSDQLRLEERQREPAQRRSKGMFTSTSPPHGMQPLPIPHSCKANGGSSKRGRPTVTKYRGICVQPDGGSTAC